MPQTLYRVDSDKIVVRKSVVSGTGFVVGKDYQPDSMHDGDIGITVRINREKLKGPLTSEQRAAASLIFREAVQEIGAVLGEDMQPGFPPGTVVTTSDVAGVVQSVNTSGLFLLRINGHGKNATSFIPFGSRIDEVPDVKGMDGLLTAIARGDVNIREERGFLKIIIERIDDEETLFAAVTRPEAGYHGAYASAIAKINDPIRLAEIIVALEKHALEDGSRNGRKTAAIKLTRMIETLTPEQRSDIMKILEPTVDLSQSAVTATGYSQSGDGKRVPISHLDEENLVSLYLALFATSTMDAQTHLSDMVIGDQDVCVSVRKLIVHEHLDDDHISAIAEVVIDKIEKSNNQTHDTETQQLARAVIDRLPNNHPALTMCVKMCWNEPLVVQTLQKIDDIAILESILKEHEKRDGTQPSFATAIWKRLRDIAPPAPPSAGGSKSYK